MLGRPLMMEPEFMKACGVVIDLFGLHRANDRDIIRYRANLGKGLGDFLSRFAILFEIEDGAACFQDGILQLGQLLTFSEGFRKRLTIQFFQLGLVVQRLELAGTTRHTEMDDSFRPGFEMKRIDDAFPLLHRGRKDWQGPGRLIRRPSAKERIVWLNRSFQTSTKI